MGNNKWLLEVVISLGAYQGTYRYYYLDESGGKRIWKEVLFKQLAWNHSDEIRERLDPELFGSPSFDIESSLITTFVKGRGIGDCGSLISYKFSDGETELIEYRHRDLPDFSEEIDFENIPPPEEWEAIDVITNYPKWTDADEQDDTL